MVNLHHSPEIIYFRLLLIIEAVLMHFTFMSFAKIETQRPLDAVNVCSGQHAPHSKNTLTITSPAPSHAECNVVNPALPLTNVTIFSPIPAPILPLGRRWHVNVTVLPATLHERLQLLQYLRGMMERTVQTHHACNSVQHNTKCVTATHNAPDNPRIASVNHSALAPMTLTPSI